MSLVVHVLIHSTTSTTDIIGVYTEKSVAEKLIESSCEGSNDDPTHFEIVTRTLNMVK